MSIANFGLIPYGHTIMGDLKFVATNEYGCDSFNNSIKSGDELSPIVIVRRGVCSFVQKVRNIEHGGGKLAIIVDEVDNEDPDMIIMVDDGTGNGIQIPSVMISKTDGEKLIAEYEKMEANGGYIKLRTTFDINNPDDRVEYDIWFSSSNDRGMDFIRDFEPYHKRLGDKTLMTPRYFTWSCENCDESITDVDCVSSGKYCAIDETNYSMTGKSIILENLRQKCIYLNAMKNKKDDSSWWNYVKKAHSRCYNDFTEDCSKEIHNELSINYAETIKCVDDSFASADHNVADNSILSLEAIAWENHGAHYIPSVIINSVAYRGILDPENVFSAICNGFKDVQDECRAYVEETDTTVDDKVTFDWFIIVIIFLIILNIGLLLL
jgi:hypothetical protein